MKPQSLKHFSLLTIMTLSLSSCLSDCKSTVKPANPYLDPQVIEEPQNEAPVAGAQADPLSSKQWSNDKLELNTVWAKYKGTKRVKVAVISSGVDYNHEDLRANILVNLKENAKENPADLTPVNEKDEDGNSYVDDVVGYDFIEDDGYPFDQLGLGTAAAGIIGAVHENGKGIKGVASQVSIIPIKYIGPNGQANTANLLSSLKYALTQNADIVFLHLANISFNSENPLIAKTEKETMLAVLKDFTLKDVPVVVSAGNTGTDVQQNTSVVSAFAALPNVIVVTSVDQNDSRPFIANYGKQTVHTSAPGVEIFTTLPGNQYGSVTGTFASAAYVTGALALAISEHFGRKDLKSIIGALLSTQGSDDLNSSQQHETLGGNRLNVAKFLKELE